MFILNDIYNALAYVLTYFKSGESIQHGIFTAAGDFVVILT